MKQNPYAAPSSDLLKGKPRSQHEETRPVEETERATQLRRFLNNAIDSVAVMGMGLPFGIVLMIGLAIFAPDKDATAVIESLPDLPLGIGLILIYYGVCEGIWGRTLGKLLTRTKVVQLDGRPLGVGRALLRTLIRFIPFEAFSFLGSERPLGLHDRWTGSAVVEVKRRANPPHATQAELVNM